MVNEEYTYLLTETAVQQVNYNLINSTPVWGAME